MSEFRRLMDKLYSKNSSREEMDETSDILDELFDKLKEANHPLYHETINKFEDIAYRITLPFAEKKVTEMKPYGQKWAYHEIEDYLKSKGIDSHCIDFYLCMNMAYNDYHELAKNVDKEEDADFYFELAKEFIFDIDAKPHKVAKYFM